MCEKATINNSCKSAIFSSESTIITFKSTIISYNSYYPGPPCLRVNIFTLVNYHITRFHVPHPSI